ncbi:hypothetical protein KIH27_11120 [Mycobacterium sp. M1]|uniref:Uncharacterized protein n=2 Tax=Mycolicibacter acidiphilus TaxID=2835306 RepID=A0ABS5RIL3_9MYCO|nr:hypothetical protein [Mycolicibacter acidiphilus]
MTAAATLVLPVPNAVAAPDVPDLSPLIDASGPLPATVADLTGIPDLAFTTPSGLACRKSRGKVTHSLACTGNFPGAPAGTHSVSLAAVYADGDGPALFLPTAPAGLLGDPAKVPTTMLMPGHKIVFWDFSPTQSLVCGTPPGTEMVCVLNAAHENGVAKGPAVTHGFVIAAPDSRVF